VFSNGSLLESMFSVKQFDADVFPNIEEPMSLFPEQNFGGFFNRQDRDSFRYQWFELYHFPVKEWHGQHNLKIGVDIGYSTYTGRIASNTVRVLRENRTLAEQIDFIGNTRVERNNTESSAFIQDKWLATPKLTFDVGLRYERDGVAEDNNVAPRVGFVFVPWLAGHTAIRGGFGVFFDKIPLNVATFDQQQNRVVTRFAEDGVTVLDGPRSFLNLVDQAEINNPYSLAWSLEVDREITRKLLFRFGYQQREGRREHLVEPIAGPGGVQEGGPRSGHLPGGQRHQGLQALAPPRIPHHLLRPAEEGQRLELGQILIEQGAVLPLRPLRLQEAPDRDPEFVRLDRLAQVIGRAPLQRLHRGPDVLLAGDHHHREVGPGLPDAPERLETVHPRHHQVQQDQVGGRTRQALQGLGSAGRGLYGVAVRGEEIVVEGAEEGVIVNGQDPLAGHGARAPQRPPPPAPPDPAASRPLPWRKRTRMGVPAKP